MPREIITLQCGECKERNYSTTKNRKTTPDRIETEEVLRPVPQASGAQRSEVVGNSGLTESARTDTDH